MIVYSLLLTLALAVSAPWWIWRMATSGRYRAGLAARLGVLPGSLDETIARRGASAGLIWLHAVSVGEVLAAQRLVADLQIALPAHLLVVSTTTETGQRIAGEKLGGVPVFYYPLDFAFAVRRYLRALKPSLFVTVESEFWPRMLIECERAGVPVAVVNARISDRSFPRYTRLRFLWRPLLAKVSLFLAQGPETSLRLRALGVVAERILVTGNLKYDLPALSPNRITQVLRAATGNRKVIVAGSTGQGDSWNEEELVLQAMACVWQAQPDVLLVLAPRHPARFDYAASLAAEHGVTRATELLQGKPLPAAGRQTLLLDTIGDLASVYSIASVAFVGGSLASLGGHNPLEPARFGVPVIMGPSFENFREIVTSMQVNQSIRIVSAGTEGKYAADASEQLARAFEEILLNDQGQGKRGQIAFEQQTGTVKRTQDALLALLGYAR